MPAATLTLYELTAPLIGKETTKSHFSLTSLCRPLPSLPRTKAVGTVRSISQMRLLGIASRPATQYPLFFRDSMSCAMLVTRASLIWDAAPALALTTVALRCGAAVLGKKNSVGAGRFRRAQDGAQIVRILDSIQNDQESGRLRLLQNILGVQRGHLRREAENPLVAGALGFPVQPGPLFEGNADMALPGQVDNFLDAGILLPALDADPLDFFRRGLDRLRNRINSMQYRHIDLPVSKYQCDSVAESELQLSCAG